MKETIHILILQHQILKVQKSLNHDEYCYHIKQFILTSANSYCNFHVLFTYYILYFPLANSYCNFHILFIYYVLHFPLGTSTLNFHVSVFLYWSHLKADAVHLSDSFLFRTRSIIGQLNGQAAAAENQEQYTSSNIMHIAFQNWCSFLRRFPW